jgi:dihydroorotate dehydrogenase electron transfer subunit
MGHQNRAFDAETFQLPAGRSVLACGPEPMLEAVRGLRPDAQLAWEAPMACGYGACYGCVVEIDGALKRLCVEGPVL